MPDLLASIGIAKLLGAHAGVRSCLPEWLRFPWWPPRDVRRCACEAG